MLMCEGKWPNFGVNANLFIFAIQVSNVLLSNEIILCHHLFYIDYSPPYCLMLIIYLLDNVT